MRHHARVTDDTEPDAAVPKSPWLPTIAGLYEPEKGGCHGTVFLMESVSQRGTRADVTRSVHDHASFAQPESPSSSADHRTPRYSALATKLHHIGAAGGVATTGESVPASPVLTTRVDHQRESSPVGSVHTPMLSVPP